MISPRRWRCPKPQCRIRRRRKFPSTPLSDARRSLSPIELKPASVTSATPAPKASSSAPTPSSAPPAGGPEVTAAAILLLTSYIQYTVMNITRGLILVSNSKPRHVLLLLLCFKRQDTPCFMSSSPTEVSRRKRLRRVLSDDDRSDSEYVSIVHF
jgi:hypothetical protein